MSPGGGRCPTWQQGMAFTAAGFFSAGEGTDDTVARPSPSVLMEKEVP